MITREEKEELLRDGFDLGRKRDFALVKENIQEFRSLDDYLQFLMNIQKIFEPIEITKKLIIAKFNKL